MLGSLTLLAVGGLITSHGITGAHRRNDISDPSAEFPPPPLQKIPALSIGGGVALIAAGVTTTALTVRRIVPEARARRACRGNGALVSPTVQTTVSAEPADDANAGATRTTHVYRITLEQLKWHRLAMTQYNRALSHSAGRIVMPVMLAIGGTFSNVLIGFRHLARSHDARKLARIRRAIDNGNLPSDLFPHPSVLNPDVPIDWDSVRPGRPPHVHDVSLDVGLGGLSIRGMF